MAGTVNSSVRETSSSSSSYMVLLNTLATDLDFMLSDLCTTPPPPFEGEDLEDPDTPQLLRGDAFLEPYMQGLPPDFTSSHHLHQSPPGSHKDGDEVHSTNNDVIDAPTNHNTNNITDLAQFRLLDIDGSADSLDQDHHSDMSSSASSDGGDSGGDAPCDIGLVERLIRSHPVWFLPGIQRAGAFHLLQGKEEGNFVVRQSSQPDTMAISVRLPMGKGPYIEHYLIQACDGQLSLESSDNRFESIPSLIAHYSQCCDELPVQLTLPRAMREARNRQQLSSLALLGQEFWRYPMANPRPPDALNAQHQRGSTDGHQSPPSSGSSLSSFGSGNNNNQSTGSRNRTPTSEGAEIVLNLAPLCGEQQHHSIMSTFKGTSPVDLGSPASPTSSLSGISGGFIVTTTSATHITTSQLARTRPTPPNTLNLATSASPTPTSGMRSTSNSPAQILSPSAITDSRAGALVLSSGGKTPPPPPPRWAKPTALSGQNYTVTTTVTFSVNHPSTPPPHVEVSCVQVTPKRPQIEMDGMSSLSNSLEQKPARIQQVMSPTTPAGTPNGEPKHARSKKHRPSHSRQPSVKESHHYQESDILDSPTVYYRSSIADKISDYEDVWGPEMLTFKPHAIPRSSPFSSPEEVSLGSCGNKKSPDLLERVGTPVSSSCVSLNSTKESQRNRLGLVINTSTPATNSPLSPATPDVTEPVSTPPPAKQGSPFYAEPADALRQAALVPRRKPPLFQNQPRNRHSDPTLVWPASYHQGILERIDSSDELPQQGFSSSVDNLAVLRNSRNAGRPKGKPVQPPRIRPGHLGGKSFNDTSWAVDSSWEFIGNEEEEEEDEEEDEEFREERERRFPTLEQQETTLEDAHSSAAKKITVQELIAQRFPALRLSPEIVPPCVASHFPASPLEFGPDFGGTVSSRISSYDNVERRNGHSDSSSTTNNNNRHHRCSGSLASDNDDTATIFSEPWDSSRWENLLDINAAKTEEPPAVTNGGTPVCAAQVRPFLRDFEEDARCEPRANGNIGRTKSFKERLDPLLSPPRLQALRNRDVGGTGSSIRAYALHLAGDKSTTFAQNIDNFIACTKESRETSPQVVMRNMRQFMSGMKNYLVKHGEREFEKEVEKERMKLKATEFLNLDAILEGVMHKLVVRPLKEHLYRLFVDEYTRSGAIQLLADNIEYARTKPLLELGIRAKIVPPTERSLETICHYLTSLQQVDSPLEKLENLLTCISTIFNSVKSSNAGRGCITLGADDFLPLFVWVLVQSNMVAAEIEAEYMWGLLHPSLLSGEGGYYLTTLSSAVHVLKNFRACSEEQSRSLAAGGSLDWQSSSLTEFRSVLKIVVPDEMHGSIITKTLPVRPNMTTRDVCKIIAHKVRITNPQDYGLFKLVDGEETLLSDGECPQDVKGNVTQVGKHVMFAYKRIDAKIAWPRTSSPQ